MKKIIFWFGMSVTVLTLCLVFSGCASSSKLYVSKERREKFDLPGGGQAPVYEMLFYVVDYKHNYTLYKSDVPGVIRSYIIEVKNTNAWQLRGEKQLLDRMRATAEVSGQRLTEKLYIVRRGPFNLVVDGVTYSLGIISENKLEVSFRDDSYIVNQKIASLGNVYSAILNCSQLSIDGHEIPPDGITAIKRFLE